MLLKGLPHEQGDLITPTNLAATKEPGHSQRDCKGAFPSGLSTPSRSTLSPWQSVRIMS